MQKYDISIIIPAYNCEKYISRCINSIINQKFKNIEIIIINDGSTDSTLIKCEDFKKKFQNVVLVNQKNNGVSYSRNVGLKRATGRYIMFIDADDYLVDDCFTNIKELLNKNYDIIKFSYYIKESNNIKSIVFEEKLYDAKVCNRSSFFKSFLEGHNENTVWGQLIKKELVENVVFDEKLFYGEDVLFNYEIYEKAESMFYTNKIMYNYEKNTDSVTMNFNNDKIYKKIFNLINIFDRMRLKNKIEENNKEIEKKFIKESVIQIMMLVFDDTVKKEKIIKQYDDICKTDLLKQIFLDVNIKDIKEVRYKEIYKYMQHGNYNAIYRYSKIYKLLKNIQKTLKRFCKYKHTKVVMQK